MLSVVKWPLPSSTARPLVGSTWPESFGGGSSFTPELAMKLSQVECVDGR